MKGTEQMRDPSSTHTPTAPNDRDRLSGSFQVKPFIGITGQPGVNLLELPAEQLPAPPSGEMPSDTTRWATRAHSAADYGDGGAMRFGNSG